jgi:glycosyltransferase involved in cell wall biosynthesis
VRVLLVSNYAWTVFNFRRRLIQHLEQQGHEVYVQTEFDGYEDRLGLPATRVLPLRIDRKGMNPFRDVLTIFSIARCIQRTRADACLFFTIKPVVYGGIAAILLSRRHISNITGLGTAFLRAPWLRRVAEILFRISLRRTDRVFFQNEQDLAEFVKRGLVAQAVTSLLPGSGVDTIRFALAPPAGNAAPVFLMISRLLRDKGVVEFVEACRLMKKTFPQARFQLLGPLNVVNRTAITNEDVRGWIEEGTIEYLGETDDVKPYIEAADCIVLPSYREGMPRSLLEASAVGRPIVATDVPGCKQVVEDGETGFLCRARSASDLAAKMARMARLSQDRRREMGEAARRKVEREFDEDLVLEQYSRALQQIAVTIAPHQAQRGAH